MRAMILAAGRGSRMGDLTAHKPKALLQCGDRLLIEHAICSLINAGIKEIVINVAYYAELIKKTLGDGQRYGITIFYSVEEHRLETGGGIYQALPLLGGDPFVVISGDIVTNFPIENLFLRSNCLAHLVMVNNPPYHLAGDFGIDKGFASRETKPFLTFGNIGLYHPDLFENCTPGYFALFKLVNKAIDCKLVTAEHYKGTWHNIGKPEDLHLYQMRAQADSNLRSLSSETNTLSN